MATGYVKLHRGAEEHPVFDDPWIWKVFCWCLWRANYRDGRMPRGAFTTGRIQAADRLRASPSSVYRALRKLESLGCITLKSNNRFTTVSICNYETYQSDDASYRTTDEQQADNGWTADEQRMDSERTTSEQQADTLKEGKEIKEGEEGTGASLVVYPSAEFLLAWNSAPGAVPARRIAGTREKHFNARLRDPSWDWQAALAKFPLKCFAAEPSGWQPNIDWFLKPETVGKILEGAYDWTKPNPNAPPPPRVRPKKTREDERLGIISVARQAGKTREEINSILTAEGYDGL